MMIGCNLKRVELPYLTSFVRTGPLGQVQEVDKVSLNKFNYLAAAAAATAMIAR